MRSDQLSSENPIGAAATGRAALGATSARRREACSTLHDLRRTLWLVVYARIVERGVAFEPDPRTLELAEMGTHRAEEMLARWVIPPDTVVAGTFTAGEYRAASEVVKAPAGVTQIFDDYREPRDPPRLPVRHRAAWIDYIRSRTPIYADHADAILSFLTRAPSDVHDQGRLARPRLTRLSSTSATVVWHSCRRSRFGTTDNWRCAQSGRRARRPTTTPGCLL